MTIMRMLVLSTLVVSTTALAGEGVPHGDWCSAGEPLEVARISVLREAVVQSRPPGDPACPVDPDGRGDCGQFDDDYRRRATQMATQGCTGFMSQSAPGGEFGRTIFLADSHVGWPITGSCIRCEASLEPPVR